MNNNEDIHKLKTQNEKLLKRLKDTCSSSYISYCHMVDCLEDFPWHDGSWEELKITVFGWVLRGAWWDQITCCGGRGSWDASG